MTCDQFCARYRMRYACIALCGALSFIAFHLAGGSIGAGLPELTRVTRALEVFDTVMLPRSLLDIDAVERNRSSGYLLATELMLTSAAIVGVFNIVRQVRDYLRRYPDGTVLSSPKYVFVCLIGVVACLLFHPPSLRFTSIKDNYLDAFGIYLLRESVLVSIGYYYLSVLCINAIAYRKAAGLRRMIS